MNRQPPQDNLRFAAGDGKGAGPTFGMFGNGVKLDKGENMKMARYLTDDELSVIKDDWFGIGFFCGSVGVSVLWLVALHWGFVV